jgi:hypothetical protein
VQSPGAAPAVAKLVPKAPGGERELLFVDVVGMRNVVPVIDSGETDDCWVLVMPRATKSLREHIQQLGRPRYSRFEVDQMSLKTGASDCFRAALPRSIVTWQETVSPT